MNDPGHTHSQSLCLSITTIGTKDENIEFHLFSTNWLLLINSDCECVCLDHSFTKRTRGKLVVSFCFNLLTKYCHSRLINYGCFNSSQFEFTLCWVAQKRTEWDYYKALKITAKSMYTGKNNVFNLESSHVLIYILVCKKMKQMVKLYNASLLFGTDCAFQEALDTCSCLDKQMSIDSFHSWFIAVNNYFHFL